MKSDETIPKGFTMGPGIKAEWPIKRYKNSVTGSPKTGEVNNSPSITIPDDTMSMREIVHRYARGLPIGGAKEVYFEEEGEEMPDFAGMDVIDRHNAQESAMEEIARTKRKMANEKANKYKAKPAAEKPKEEAKDEPPK